MSEVLKEITNDSFKDEVINDTGVVVVDYYAEWCGPCKMMAIAIGELSQEYSDDVKIVKADVEQNSDSVSKFGIQGVPAILVFKGGELKKQNVGIRSKKDIRKDIEEVRNA